MSEQVEKYYNVLVIVVTDCTLTLQYGIRLSLEILLFH
jgi:hypothetical protein